MSPITKQARLDYIRTQARLAYAQKRPSIVITLTREEKDTQLDSVTLSELIKDGYDINFMSEWVVEIFHNI
jgi:hypothetical protein